MVLQSKSLFAKGFRSGPLIRSQCNFFLSFLLNGVDVSNDCTVNGSFTKFFHFKILKMNLLSF